MRYDERQRARKLQKRRGRARRGMFPSRVYRLEAWDVEYKIQFPDGFELGHGPGAPKRSYQQ